MANRNGRFNLAANSIPSGFVVGEYSTHQAASEAVSKLIQNDFPARLISIVGSDLKLVERVRGRLGYGRIALSGALAGVWIGLLFAILIGAGMETTAAGEISYAPEQFLSTIVTGIGVGMLLNVIRFALAKKKRTFLSVAITVAQSYQVLVPEPEASKAQQALAKG